MKTKCYKIRTPTAICPTVSQTLSISSFQSHHLQSPNVPQFQHLKIFQTISCTGKQDFMSQFCFKKYVHLWNRSQVIVMPKLFKVSVITNSWLWHACCMLTTMIKGSMSMDEEDEAPVERESTGKIHCLLISK